MQAAKSARQRRRDEQRALRHISGPAAADGAHAGPHARSSPPAAGAGTVPATATARDALLRFLDRSNAAATSVVGRMTGDELPYPLPEDVVLDANRTTPLAPAVIVDALERDTPCPIAATVLPHWSSPLDAGAKQLQLRMLVQGESPLLFDLVEPAARIRRTLFIARPPAPTAEAPDVSARQEAEVRALVSALRAPKDWTISPEVLISAFADALLRQGYYIAWRHLWEPPYGTDTCAAYREKSTVLRRPYYIAPAGTPPPPLMRKMLDEPLGCGGPPLCFAIDETALTDALERVARPVWGVARMVLGMNEEENQHGIRFFFRTVARVLLIMALILASSAISIVTVAPFAVAFARDYDYVGLPVVQAVVRVNMPTVRPAVPITEDSVHCGWTIPIAGFTQLLDMTKQRYEELTMTATVPLDADGSGEEHLEGRVRRPSSGKYGKYQWLWDSAFHVRVASHFAVDTAVEELTMLLSQQRSDGFVPEISFWGGREFDSTIATEAFGYSHPAVTDITQMPVLAFALEAVHDALHRVEDESRFCPVATDSDAGDGDAEAARQRRLRVLCQLLPRIHRYHMWWLETRDPDGDGLVSIIHPWESGLDASPLYDPVHTFNRARRYGIDPERYTTWGASMLAKRPRPTELYPEFFLLRYSYRNAADNWDTTRILDPVAAQSRCYRAENGEGPLRDVRGATWDAADQLRRARHRLHRRQERRTALEGRPYPTDEDFATRRDEQNELLTTPLIDTVFDVEDVGVNSVLAANMDTAADLYQELLRGVEAMSEAEFAAFRSANGGDRGNGALCCASGNRTLQDAIRNLRAQANEARRAASTVAAAVRRAAWNPATRHFDSFHHVTYHTGDMLAGTDRPFTCVHQRVLATDTVQSLLPLLLGHRLTDDLAASILDKLEDTERYGFTGSSGIPTVSRAEKEVFEPRDSALMWRGPAWAPTNWLVARGLARVATDRGNTFSSRTRDRAAFLHRRLLSSWTRQHRSHGVFEYHEPNTGKGMGQPGLGMAHLIVDAAEHAMRQPVRLRWAREGRGAGRAEPTCEDVRRADATWAATLMPSQAEDADVVRFYGDGSTVRPRQELFDSALSQSLENFLAQPFPSGPVYEHRVVSGPRALLLPDQLDLNGGRSRHRMLRAYAPLGDIPFDARIGDAASVEQLPPELELYGDETPPLFDACCN